MDKIETDEEYDFGLARCSVCGTPSRATSGKRFWLWCNCFKVGGVDWVKVISAWNYAMLGPSAREIEAENRAKALKMDLSEIPLSVHTTNAMYNLVGKRWNSDDKVLVSELVLLTESQLLKQQGFGRKSLEEWRGWLAQFGLKIGVKG